MRNSLNLASTFGVFLFFQRNLTLKWSFLASCWRCTCSSRSAFWNLHSDSRSRYSHLSTSIPESYSPSSDCYCILCIFGPYSTFYFFLSIFINSPWFRHLLVPNLSIWQCSIGSGNVSFEKCLVSWLKLS
jgi:hypothetical protein